NRVDDEPAQERNDRFDQTAHVLLPRLACLERRAPPAEGRLPGPQLIVEVKRRKGDGAFRNGLMVSASDNPFRT
ncbi:MAG TPA: hypothetical protein VJR69_10945, partial [Nitrospira sp.]|nr:hypothetical protein [Nitrospira sp.]